MLISRILKHTTHAFIIASALFTAALGVSGTAKADEAMEKMIAARQGFYQMVRHNAGILFGMAKGDTDYDAAGATTAANNLLALSKLDNSSLWIAGSSKEEMPGKTRALKKIWDTYPAITEKSTAWKQAVADMAAVAGGGVDALREKASALAAGCKGCHDNFRAEDF